ncbi:hypothetical protein [Pseudoprimorskyibacter insulae]|nr:hypothetical protein [Pseudoprimorskyibacter insulae]
MEPIYALSLSFEGIALLRKAQAGWVVLGDVSLEAPDLAGALTALRQSAGAVAEQVKLIIPNEQIKYLSVKDRGSSGPLLDAQIQGALDGATPYDVLDLRYDHSKADGQVLIAAVAKETLGEAEAFAVAHGFQPVAYCAVAAPGDFVGEVFFGAGTGWTGEAPVRAAEALRIVAAAIIDEPPRTAAPQPAPEVEPAPVEAAEPVVEIAVAEPVAAPKVEAPAPVEAAPEVEAEAPAPPAPAPKSKPKPKPATATISAPAIQDPVEPAPAFTSIRASRGGDQGAAPSLLGADRAPDLAANGPAVSLPKANVEKTSRPVFGAAAKPAAPANDEQRGPAGRTLGFFSRRKSDAPETEAEVPPAPAAPSRGPMAVATSALRLKTAAAQAAQDEAEAERTKEDIERERLTIFGQREPQKIGGKPRFLGLMLTAALLLFLAGVAAWASVFLDTGLARLFTPTGTEEIQIGDVELPTPVEATEILPAEGVEVAALDPNFDPEQVEGQESTADVVSMATMPQILTAEEAEATYAATGIWQRTPDAPALPVMIGLGEVYTTNLDPAVIQYDAVALQAPRDHASDLPFAGLSDPVSPETTFDLDDRGLVRATPEGALNPEGVLVYLGKPPIVAPNRPAEAALLAEDPEALAIRIRMKSVRPQLRPEDVTDGNERARFGGFTQDELAKLRPQARPDTGKELAEADTTATAQAVATSRRPITRPRNFAATVAAAVKKQETTPAPAPVQQAAATITPKIPSSASVAKQATVKNAINLNKINLIGVYGKPSSRRALVRLSNGRYKKVQVGDSIDGGRVAAIGEGELRYVKSGRNVVIKLPQG